MFYFVSIDQYAYGMITGERGVTVPCLTALAEMGDRLATIDMGRKVGMGYCAPFGGGDRAVSQSNTMWPGPRHISVPSGILIHPAV